MRYASFVSGVSRGQRVARAANASSDTSAAAWSFMLRVCVSRWGRARRCFARTRRSRSSRRRRRTAPSVATVSSGGGTAAHGSVRTYTGAGGKRAHLAVGRAVERLADDVLLHLRAAVRVELLLAALAEHLLLRVHVHRDLEEGLVEERHACLEAPRHCRSAKGELVYPHAEGASWRVNALIGAQAVGGVQVLHAAHALLVQGLCVWGFVEVEVSYGDRINL